MILRPRVFPAAFTLVCSLLTLAACNSDGGAGPDPISPQYYALTSVDNGSLPSLLWEDAFGGRVLLESATLVPYAVGRTVDQRLINDRTGRGGSGGNTRDTTVLRGQMMDIRVVRFALHDGTIVHERDSMIVDVEIRDTVFIITRPFPDPARVAHDTGAVLGRLLIVPTRISRANYGSQAGYPAVLQYTITR